MCFAINIDRYSVILAVYGHSNQTGRRIGFSMLLLGWCIFFLLVVIIVINFLLVVVIVVVVVVVISFWIIQ